jgi:chromosome segregation ATPase
MADKKKEKEVEESESLQEKYDELLEELAKKDEEIESLKEDLEKQEGETQEYVSLSQRLQADFENFKNKTTIFERKCGMEDYESVCKITDKILSDAIDEIRIVYRQFVLAKDKRLFYVIRQEEVASTLNKFQGEVDKFNKLVEEKGEEEAMRTYTNVQLNDLNQKRSQLIPFYTTELEVISSAIRDNEEVYFATAHKCTDIISGIIEYLNKKLDILTGKQLDTEE